MLLHTRSFPTLATAKLKGGNCSLLQDTCGYFKIGFPGNSGRYLNAKSLSAFKIGKQGSFCRGESPYTIFFYFGISSGKYDVLIRVNVDRPTNLHAFLSLASTARWWRHYTSFHRLLCSLPHSLGSLLLLLNHLRTTSHILGAL